MPIVDGLDIPSEYVDLYKRWASPFYCKHCGVKTKSVFDCVGKGDCKKHHRTGVEFDRNTGKDVYTCCRKPYGSDGCVTGIDHLIQFGQSHFIVLLLWKDLGLIKNQIAERRNVEKVPVYGDDGKIDKLKSYYVVDVVDKKK